MNTKKGQNGRRQFLQGAAAVTAGVAVASTPIRSWAQSAKTLDVSIVNSNATIELAFGELIKRKGYLEEMGVNATTSYVTDGSRVMAGLISGQMDVCMKSGFGQVLPAVARNAPVKVIAGASLLIPQGVMTSDPNIKSIADLKGKKIGTGPVGALEYQLMVAVLMKYNIDISTISFVNIGATPDIFRAISAGVVDAGPVNVDVYNRQSPKARVIADFWKELPNYPYQGSFTSIASIQNKREALIRVMAAYCKMYRYIQTPESKQPYIDAYVAATGSKPEAGEAQWNFQYQNKVYATDLLIPAAKLEYMQNLNIQTGVQKTKMPLTQFSDMSLVPAALKLIGG